MEIQIEFWHWWVLALCFIVFYAMMPLGVLLALTISTGILGAVIMQFPFMAVSPQLALFGTVTISFTMLLSYLKQKKRLNALEQGDSPAHEMLGKEFELTKPMHNGFSEITLDGTHWSLKGPRIKEGTLVRVLKLDGEMLMVMPVDIINDYRKEQSSNLNQ